jgi:hypothetical protein
MAVAAMPRFALLAVVLLLALWAFVVRKDN